MKILLGFDGSALADHAIGEVSELTDRSGEVTVAVYGVDDEAEIGKRVEDQFETAGIDVDIRHIEGNPGGRLVEMAEAEGFDRIVLPGGSRSPLGKIQLDSVVEFVVLNAQTSVTLAR